MNVRIDCTWQKQSAACIYRLLSGVDASDLCNSAIFDEYVTDNDATLVKHFRISDDCGAHRASLKTTLNHVATRTKLGKNLAFKHKYFCAIISRGQARLDVCLI